MFPNNISTVACFHIDDDDLFNNTHRCALKTTYLSNIVNATHSIEKKEVFIVYDVYGYVALKVTLLQKNCLDSRRWKFRNW